MLEELCCWVEAQPETTIASVKAIQENWVRGYLSDIVLSLPSMLLQTSPPAWVALLAIPISSKTRTSLLLYSARSLATWSIQPLKPLRRLFLLTMGSLSIALLPETSTSMAQTETAADDSQEEIVQQILELREQIEALLEMLPEEVREEVERRWRERLAAAEEAEEPLSEEPITEVEAAVEPETESDPVVAQDLEIESSTDIEEVIVTDAEIADTEPPIDSVEEVPPCGGVYRWDTNEDDLLSGGDRQWRFLRLWFDADNDGSVDEDELESLFDLGVRMIDVELAYYLNDQGDKEDIDVDDRVWLRQVGKGRRSGALVIDADRLVRDGRIWLTDADNVQLTGIQPLRPGIFLETKEGEKMPLLCRADQDPNLN